MDLLQPPRLHILRKCLFSFINLIRKSYEKTISPDHKPCFHASGVFAGGIVTNSNQSAYWVRTLVRDAAIGADAVYLTRPD